MLPELIQYNHIANLKVIDVFKNAGKIIPDAERLFSHILNAHFIWICRIKGVETKIDRFQLQEQERFSTIESENSAALLSILNNDDLARIVQYSNSSGDVFKNTVADIVYHIVNHSTYHRGQIAMLFRQHQVQPPVTDYIFYKREGKL